MADETITSSANHRAGRVAPMIEPNYLVEDLDRRVLVEGIRILREIYAQPAFRELVEVEELPGTCRMGSDEGSVVDSELRVRGVQRLRVIDASVMPEIVSANTNATAIMIGEKGTEIVLGSHGSQRLGSHALL